MDLPPKSTSKLRLLSLFYSPASSSDVQKYFGHLLNILIVSHSVDPVFSIKKKIVIASSPCARVPRVIKIPPVRCTHSGLRHIEKKQGMRHSSSRNWSQQCGGLLIRADAGAPLEGCFGI